MAEWCSPEILVVLGCCDGFRVSSPGSFGVGAVLVPGDHMYLDWVFGQLWIWTLGLIYWVFGFWSGSVMGLAVGRWFCVGNGLLLVWLWATFGPYKGHLVCGGCSLFSWAYGVENGYLALVLCISSLCVARLFSSSSLKLCTSL